MAKSWKRQKDETNASYHAFTEYYLSQDPPRTLVQAYKTYRLAKGVKTVIPPPNGTWQRWYRSNHWNNRAIDYDDHLFELEQKLFVVEKRKIKKRLTKVSTEMLRKLEDMCKFPITEIIRTDEEGGVTIIKPAGWKLSDISKFSKAVTDMMYAIELLDNRAKDDIDQKVIIQVVGNVSVDDQ